MVSSLGLTIIPETMAVCRLPAAAPLPALPQESTLWAVTRTSDELSLVLPQKDADPSWQMEGGWRALKVMGGWLALKVMGPLDFSLTGILAGLSSILAEAGLSIFAISTFDTDYILVREDKLDAAVAALRGAGHAVSEGP